MYRIWVDVYDDEGKFAGSSVSVKIYKRKGNAIRYAERNFGNNPRYIWKIWKIRED